MKKSEDSQDYRAQWKKRQYLHYGNSRRRERKKNLASVFKTITAENFSNLEEKWTDPWDQKDPK